MPTRRLPNGVYEHTFSATWLKDYATCPEKSRYRYYRLQWDPPNEFMVMGSAVHKGLETALLTKLDGGEPNQEIALSAAYNLWDERSAEPEFHYVRYSQEQVIDYIRQAIEVAFDTIIPAAQPLAVEAQFDLPLYEDQFRIIRLRGAIDYVDAVLGPIDWKTAGKAHKEWEKDRWDIQSTVYTWAWEALGNPPPGGMSYVVFLNGKRQTQEYHVKRNAGHVAWLTQQALGAAHQIEANLPLWTMNDQGWWCAEKWCPVWDKCKGKALNSHKETDSK